MSIYTYTTLDDPSATVGTGDGTEARGINNSGQIVGYYLPASSRSSSSYQGFLYSNGVYTTLEDPTDGVSTGSSLGYTANCGGMPG